MKWVTPITVAALALLAGMAVASAQDEPLSEGVVWSTDEPVPMTVTRKIDRETGQPYYVQQGISMCVPVPTEPRLP